MQINQILREEIDKAIRELQDGKSSEIDEITSEILKSGGEKLYNKLYKVILEIHVAGVISEDFGIIL